MDRNDVKMQSPHPGLQTVLPQLSTLSPTNEVRPVFETREEAENFLAVLAEAQDGEYHLKPVWAINHSDLSQSEIAAWSVGEYVN